MKKLFIFFSVMIIFSNSCQKITPTQESGIPQYDDFIAESLNSVAFVDGIFPEGWKTYSWEISDIGFDDNYSIKSVNSTSIVYANKTMSSRFYVEFYTKGKDIHLYIDDIKAKAFSREEVGDWDKWIFKVDSGKHQFQWFTKLNI